MRAESGVPASRRDVVVAGVTSSLLSYSRPPTVQAAPSLEERRVPRTRISEDLEISKVIKGCWQLGGGHRGGRSDRTSGHAAVEDIHTFVQNGITTLDTADIYGPSEKIIGSYRKEFPSEGRDCQVLTKFCCFNDAMERAGHLDFVSASLDRSRENIGVECLDCVQFFWADYGVKQYVSAALSLSELQARGVTRTVGVTNFDVQRLDELVKAGVRVATNQIQYSLLDTRPENGMTEFCASNGIVILPYGTVAGGFLSSKYLGKPAEECVIMPLSLVDICDVPNLTVCVCRVRMNTYSLQKYASIIRQRGGWDWFQRLLQTLHNVANVRGVSIADVASRWVLQKNGVGSIIVGARNTEHIDDHMKLFQFALTDDDLGQIQEVLDQGRRPTSDVYTFERGGSW